MRIVGVLCLGVIVLSGGCGRKGPTTQTSGGTLSGKVLFQGAPVTGGTISFSRDGKTVIGTALKADGTYSLEGVPLGELTVTVETKSLEQLASRGGGGGLARPALPDPKSMNKDAPPAKNTNTTVGLRYVPIPEKYAKAETSPLRVTVAEGKQDKDFKLD